MGYEVEIKAKMPLISKRNNKTDELAFINTLVCMMYECAERAEMKAEIAESKGNEEEMKVRQGYKDVMLYYANELGKQYDEEKERETK